MAPYFAPGTAVDAKAVTPSDSTDLSNGTCQALWVGTAGNVSVITAAGTTVTITGASGLVPLQCSRVRSTSTTASTILALY
jgi:hypothetical protein